MDKNLEMDENLKSSIRKFFKLHYEHQSAYAEDFIIDLEEWLIKERFDLTNVIQYKKK